MARWIILSLVVVVGLSGARPAAADDVALCATASGPAAVAACTRSIDSGRFRGASLATLFVNRAMALSELGEHPRALIDFNEAARLNPRLAAAYNGRGLIYVAARDYRRALGDFDRAVKLLPRDPTILVNRGGAHERSGDDARALADYEAALRLQPASASLRVLALTCRARVLNRRGLHDRALADAAEAIRLAPGQAYPYKERGNAHFGRGAFDRAVQDHTEALRLDPGLTAARTGRGLAYERLGDVARARADFAAALAMPPKFASGEAAQVTARARIAALPAHAAVAPPAVARPEPAVPAVHAAVEPANTAVDPGRRVALVIGNSAYQRVAALPNPQRDAAAVADALRRFGFQSVTLVRDLDREALVDALRRFAAEAETADWAMVYFAGHGIEVGGVNYLIPVDAKLAVDRDVQFEAVGLEQVMTAVEGARKLRLIMLDACRDNPFMGQMRRSVATRSLGRGLGQIEPEAGTLVVYAAKHGQVALDGEGRNSPFVTALLRRMRTPGLEVRRMVDLVRDDVLAATGRRQQPFSYGSLPGSEDFYFVGK